LFVLWAVVTDYRHNVSEVIDFGQRENFTHKIGELFKCDAVEFVKLGSMKYVNTCLLEIALYFSYRQSNSPRVLGILKDKGNLRFIDRTSGNNILTLKPN
jgi:Na+/serine symporter